MAVNNEIGVIQPLAEIGKICSERKVLFHTDAAQAIGKIALDVNAMHIDLMSISGTFANENALNLNQRTQNLWS